MLVDSHCHLDFPDFAGDLDAVIDRARAAGVSTMLTISTHLTNAEAVIRVAEHWPEIFCTVGAHPHNVASEPAVDPKALVELAKHPKVVGFGETGLDFYYDNSPRDRQEASFRAHIAAAREAGLPVVIHTRDADAETARIVAEEMQAGAFTAVIHCFSSTKAMADEMVAHGFSISFSGIATFKKAEALRSVAAALPLSSILVETDAPYLAPHPLRGKRNEPAFVAHTARAIAAAKGLPEGEFAAATHENFFRLFRKARAACG